GRERGVQRRLAVHRGRLTAGILERVHLRVQHRAALLDASVVPAPDDLPLSHDYRSDRDAALTQSLFCFGDGRREERIGVHLVAARIASYSNTLGPRGASFAMPTIARATVAARMGRYRRSRPNSSAGNSGAPIVAIRSPRRTSGRSPSRSEGRKIWMRW